MATLSDLEEKTNAFFLRHWHGHELGEAPKWVEWQPFLFESVPNNGLGGCYALFQGQELAYIGLGASRGNVCYPGHGITRRLMSHVISSNKERGKKWSALKPEWSAITSIHTIGMPHAVVYLSPALESFLIRELGSSITNKRV